MMDLELTSADELAVDINASKKSAARENRRCVSLCEKCWDIGESESAYH